MEARGAASAKTLRFPTEICHMQGTARRSVWLEMSEQGGGGKRIPARIMQGLSCLQWGFGSYSECHRELPTLVAVWTTDFRGSERQGGEQLGGVAVTQVRSPYSCPEKVSPQTPQVGAHLDHRKLSNVCWGSAGISRPFQRLELLSGGLKPILRREDACVK